MSKKKTHVNKLSKPIVFLKTTFILTDTGKVIMRKDKDNFTRQRRKLKKLKIKMINGEVKYKDIEMQYMSWRGNIMCKYGKNKNSKRMYKNYKQVANMDRFYNKLFIEPFITGQYKEEMKNV